MEVLIQVLILAASLAVLLKSSDFFIENAERIGLSLGISSFIIGVTIVALGTSLPELATSIASVLLDTSDVVIGNVVGSNTTNILLVLGLTAFVGKKLYVREGVIKAELPYLFLSAVVLYFFIYDKKVELYESLLFLAMLVVYIVQTISNDEEEKPDDRPKLQWWRFLIVAAAGVGIYLSADYTIKSLVNLSEIFGVNTGVLATSLVALGTSLPEVVVSVNAMIKGKGDIALGNVIGSNIFNTYAVMGIPSLIGPLVIPQEILDFAMPFMMAVTLGLFLLGQARVIDRWGGLSLLLLYVFFMIQLFLA
ncbi:MAG TPA: calcium/sodium antiporter [Saprospiraceae bacterium]|nr:calcium/sodium antiporter [Saprospiraceae bacterium]